MTLAGALIFAAFALLLAGLSRFSWFVKFRAPLLLAASVLAVYWLQPALPIRGLDFWLPTLTLAIAVWGWMLTAGRPQTGASAWRQSLPTLLLVIGLVLGVALTRYLSAAGVITAARPPQTLQVMIFVAASALLLFLISRIRPRPLAWLWIATGEIILLFAVLKLPSLTTLTAGGLRLLTGQDAGLAGAFDIRWLGFSYIAFRLIHTLRDRQSGRLPDVTLQEYLIYLIFFPTLVAGPIDRIERFVKDLRNTAPAQASQVGEGMKRFVTGMFKKFVLADLLAMVSLSAQNAAQIHGAGWMWLSVYAFTLQIFLDFSGYTDIAIGTGQFMGFTLPENFHSPYLKPNLTQFWNNWHITLTTWFRSYFFNPLTRAMRSAKRPVPVIWVILIGQLATMVLIGMWHGMTWNFIAWGAWHGIGLFANNRWSEWQKRRNAGIEALRTPGRLGSAVSTFATFNFVALGWVWFALPTIPLSLSVFSRLFGGAG